MTPNLSDTKFPVKLARGIKPMTRLNLFVKANGRCQFWGCNDDLMVHNLTQTAGNFAQMAHIVAFEINGPRGDSENRPKDINDIFNLMLLCVNCHKLIDDNPNDYSCEMLKSFKFEHENRIKIMCEIGHEMKSAVLIFASPIRGQEVSIREDHVRKAMFPHYPVSSKGTQIDLNFLRGQVETPEFLEIAKNQINLRLSYLFDKGGEAEKASHLSIFGIGPIVQLMILGSSLSNKISAKLYQRQRDNEDWKWKNEGIPVKYKLTKIKEGSDQAPVALLLALSGTIPLINLPKNYQEDSTIYEITLDGEVPSTTFLKQEIDLENFRLIYLKALALISHEKGLIEIVSFFPAIPAPIAILCGRERLPKVHPRFRVYDFDHENNGFKFQENV